MTEGQMRGPINYGDLGLNMALRKFLTYLSTPLRYGFGMALGLTFGSMDPDSFALYATILGVICVLAVVWVIFSLTAKSAVRKALVSHLNDGESLSDYELMHSRSWVAAVRKERN